jgi:hypothetical protein
MVSGNPPRHSKSSQEPVTIELTAEALEQAAKASASEDTKADETAGQESLQASVAETLSEAVVTASEIPPSGELRDETPKPAEDRGFPRDEPEKRASRGSGAFVGGLVGGLIVLAGAGGLQYAGYLPTLAPNAALEEANKAMAAQIADLKARLDSLPAAQPVDLAPIESRLAEIETKLASAPSPGTGNTDDAARISALADGMAAVKADLAKLGADEAKARAGLELRLEAAEKKISEPRDDVDVARAIASAGLKAAIDRGGSFLSELDTLAGIVPDDPAVNELRTFAATGVPSRAELIALYPDVAIAMLNAVQVVDPNQSIWDRLADSARSLVKVRPVGNVEGEGPDAIVARMEVKLQNGDLKAVALEWETLPDTAKAASKDFKTKLDARIRVEDLVGSTLNRAVTGTGG